MRAEIKKLHRDLGATSIYVTHDQIEAMTMADRIVAMHAGVVQQVGTPLELYDRPANLFVAGFIGSPAMNFLSAQLTPAPGGAALQMGEHTLGPVPWAHKSAPPRTVTVGVAPNAFALLPWARACRLASSWWSRPASARWLTSISTASS